MIKNIFFMLATPLMLISGIPQIIKLLKTKNSQGISVAMYLITWLAVFIMLVKSLTIKDNSLILCNGISMIMLTINITLILKYKK